MSGPKCPHCGEELGFIGVVALDDLMHAGEDLIVDEDDDELVDDDGPE